MCRLQLADCRHSVLWSLCLQSGPEKGPPYQGNSPTDSGEQCPGRKLSKNFNSHNQHKLSVKWQHNEYFYLRATFKLLSLNTIFRLPLQKVVFFPYLHLGKGGFIQCFSNIWGAITVNVAQTRSTHICKRQYRQLRKTVNKAIIWNKYCIVFVFKALLLSDLEPLVLKMFTVRR